MTDLKTRKNVFDTGTPWADPILWYARGVQVMKSRPLADPTSWAFFGAIHGMWRALWDHYNLTDPAEAAPSTADTDTYLDQCQHQSWYFLPWHRGYLIALEEVLRAAIKDLGGPHDTWALPYWNYFADGQNILPAEFRDPSWPGGGNDNPLFVHQRWGPMGGTSAFDLKMLTNLGAMDDPVFTGPGNGVALGFGGPTTGFSPGGAAGNGGCESDPHNVVHGLVGGRNPTETFSDGTPLPGLMSNPLTAALDPIFYLHHCNIDRLWNAWNDLPPGKPVNSPSDWTNPNNINWLNGPVQSGERAFAMPKPDGSKWNYTPREMQVPADWGYDYDDLTPGAAAQPVFMAAAARMAGLGMSASAGGAPMAKQDKSEMVGASESGISLSGSAAHTARVKTAPEPRARLSDSLNSATPTAPDRVFLNLENITGLDDATLLRVFVGLPDDGADGEEYNAGTVSLFGVRKASDADSAHAGSGLNATLEITKIVDKLHLDGAFGADEIEVRLVPFDAVPEAAKIHIGRISIYRQHE
ncbi:tyrosinase family protein [Marinovum sp. KMM 9879]